MKATQCRCDIPRFLTRHCRACPAWQPSGCRNQARSGCKPEMHHIAVGDDVVLALEPHLLGVLSAGLAVVGDVVGITDRLSTDETFFEVGVNYAGRLGRLSTLCDGPSTRLLRTGGEIGDEVKQRIAGPHQTIEASLLQANRSEIVRAFVRWQHGNF